MLYVLTCPHLSWTPPARCKAGQFRVLKAIRTDLAARVLFADPRRLELFYDLAALACECPAGYPRGQLRLADGRPFDLEGLAAVLGLEVTTLRQRLAAIAEAGWIRGVQETEAAPRREALLFADPPPAEPPPVIGADGRLLEVLPAGLRAQPEHGRGRPPTPSTHGCRRSPTPSQGLPATAGQADVPPERSGTRGPSGVGPEAPGLPVTPVRSVSNSTHEQDARGVARRFRTGSRAEIDAKGGVLRADGGLHVHVKQQQQNHVHGSTAPGDMARQRQQPDDADLVRCQRAAVHALAEALPTWLLASREIRDKFRAHVHGIVADAWAAGGIDLARKHVQEFHRLILKGVARSGPDVPEDRRVVHPLRWAKESLNRWREHGRAM